MTQPPASPLSRPESISELVYDAIRDAIVKRQFSPGERVTEGALAKWLNVSKTPVREAMLRLQEVGLLEADAVRGSRVAQPSDIALQQAFEIREALEGFAAERAAATFSAAEAEHLQGVAARTVDAASAGDVNAFREHDREFHRVLTRTNPRLQKLVADTADFLRTVREQDLPTGAAMVASGQSHVRIAQAVAAGDADAAGREMREHVRQVQAHYAVTDDA